MSRSGWMLRWLGAGIVGLALTTGLRAEDGGGDEGAPVDEAVARCLTACEAAHDSCRAEAARRAEECARRKDACERGCATCTQLYGPQVVYCVQDCEACRAEVAAMRCDASADTACDKTLEQCLERCGP